MPVFLYVLGLAVFAQGTSEFMLSGLVSGIARELSVSVGAAASLTSAYAVGMILGEWYGWRSTFWAVAALCLPALALVFRSAPLNAGAFLGPLLAGAVTEGTGDYRDAVWVSAALAASAALARLR